MPFRLCFKFCTKTLLKVDASFHERQFIDKMKLKLVAGNGGTGGLSFFRDRYTKFGAGDGGDGGSGGSIILKTNDKLQDFSKFHHYIYTGNSGHGGGRNYKNGKPGGDITLQVPVGTQIYEIVTKNSIKKKHFMYDLQEAE